MTRRPRIPIEPKAQAIRLLARREHSAAELQRKLVQRGIPEDDARQAVNDVREGGWQSDLRFAQMLVRSRIARGFGPLRIEADLRQAEVSAEDARIALDEAGADWAAMCAEVHARRFGAPPRTSAERAKQYRYLAGRGFDSGQVNTVLRGWRQDVP